MLGTPGQPPSRSTDPMLIHDQLSGGNPRTLHNVDPVVKTVLTEPERLDELIVCALGSEDEIVRMRDGDALEKVCRARPLLVRPHVSLLLGDYKSLANRARKLRIELAPDPTAPLRPVTKGERSG